MPEKPDDQDLTALHALIASNQEAMEALRDMLEQLELKLSIISQKQVSGPEATKEQSSPPSP